MASGFFASSSFTAASTATVLRSTVPSADRLELERLHRPRHALEPGLAVGIVLVEDADLLDAHRGELLDDLGGLVEVRGAHVKGVAVERRAQRLGAGERRDPRHLGRRRDRQCHHARRRADVAEEREGAAVDQFLGVGGAAVGLVAVVQALQLDRPPVDAAARVDPSNSSCAPAMNCWPSALAGPDSAADWPRTISPAGRAAGAPSEASPSPAAD